ncbi:RNA-directed DNA polymerase, eukaryota, reverse transcriptase zinc-binding domain protein, partial [Tanacetum coccineum]
MARNPHNERVKAYEAECLVEYLSALNDEEKFLFQKAKVKWISNGDRNTKFFHKVIASKRNINIIMSICNEKGKLNATLITLIPKIPQPNKVSDFRTIACCNVLYKCISKIITNRIKGGLDRLINVNQSAFVPERVIQDNLMITQELLKGYNFKNGPSRCSLKIDTAMAYDTVDLSFLQVILENIGFHDRMVRWIRTCVSLAAFTIGINGERYGYFKSDRGLRQGDPVSLYLFTLIMKVFSLMLARKVKESKKFKFHKGCKEMKLTHLSFADDLLVLCHGDVDSISAIKEALLEFNNSSGLKPNMDKSVVFFGSVKEVVKQKILEILPFKVGKLPVKYLGIHLLAKKLGINDCKHLVKKVKNRIQDWKNRFSHMLEDYSSLPLNGTRSNGTRSNGRPKVAWKIACYPKKEGGLGLKQLVKLKGKIFWEIDEEGNDISTWKALLGLRNKIRSHIMHVIGNVQWVEKFPILRQLKVPLLNKDLEDIVKWKKRNGQMVELSIRDVWWDMKCGQTSVFWWYIVWFPQCNPMCAFILWMTVKEKLATHDRMMKWSNNQMDEHGSITGGTGTGTDGSEN